MTTPLVHEVFLIPEILERILLNVPLVKFSTTCRAVCKDWRQHIDTSSVLQYYSATGIRGLPSSQQTDEEECARNPTPRLTPAAEELLPIFWRNMLVIPDIEGTKEIALKESDQAERVCESFALCFSNVELLMPPPPTITGRVFIELDFDGGLPPAAPAFFLGQRFRQTYSNPFVHVIFQLYYQAFRDDWNSSQIYYGYRLIFQVVYKRNPCAIWHWSYMMLNGSKDDLKNMVAERGDHGTYYDLDVLRDRGEIKVSIQLRSG